MELWIRSQDKMLLSKAVDIRIVIEQEGASIIDETTTYILGMYKSEERALEVLDEIESCLNQKFKLSGSYEELDIQLKTKMINGLYGYIYSMPEK